MKIFTSFLVILLFQQLTFAQTESWQAYIAEYDKNPGSVTLNMGLAASAPKANFPYLVVTGVGYLNCKEDGFPKKLEFDKLYEIEDSVIIILSKITQIELVGTFTHKCQRLDYIYVKDTLGIRAKLTELFARKFNGYLPYIRIEKDSAWKEYKEFLYPSEEILEYMANQDVINNLIKAGDDLSKARQVDHWLFFSSEKDREAFAQKVKEEKFKVESMEIVHNEGYSFQIHISRKDFVDITSITKVTVDLKNLAKSMNGDYDGWETVVVK